MVHDVIVVGAGVRDVAHLGARRGLPESIARSLLFLSMSLTSLSRLYTSTSTAVRGGHLRVDGAKSSLVPESALSVVATTAVVVASSKSRRLLPNDCLYESSAPRPSPTASAPPSCGEGDGESATFRGDSRVPSPPTCVPLLLLVLPNNDTRTRSNQVAMGACANLLCEPFEMGRSTAQDCGLATGAGLNVGGKREGKNRGWRKQSP